MTGRRLVDVAAIFKASQGVAAKHVALRQHQLDIYSKTSSLAKAVKSQTDRVTLTVRAASVLAERFNGPGPDRSTQALQSRKSPHGTSIPSQDGASGTNQDLEKKDGISQDQFYERSDQNTPAESPPDGTLGVKQENAKSYSLPDGSISSAGTTEMPKRDKESCSQFVKTESVESPLASRRNKTDEGLQPTSSGRTIFLNPAEGTYLAIAEKAQKMQRQAGSQIPLEAAELPPAAQAQEPGLKADHDQKVFHAPSPSDGRALPALPRVKAPLNTQNTRESDEHVPDAQLNQNVFYSSPSRSEEQRVPQTQAIPEREQISDEVYTELFHSPRVARMLGGQPKPSRPSEELEMSAAQETSMEQIDPSERKDQVLSNYSTSGQANQDGTRSVPTGIADSKPSQAMSSEDAHDLAADLARDTEDTSADPSQVKFL